MENRRSIISRPEFSQLSLPTGKSSPHRHFDLYMMLSDHVTVVISSFDQYCSGGFYPALQLAKELI